MDELADLKAAVDVLIARSMAQEAMLVFFMREAQLKTQYFLDSELGNAASELRERLRQSSLTDAQIALYETEIQRLVRSLLAPPNQDRWNRSF